MDDQEKIEEKVQLQESVKVESHSSLLKTISLGLGVIGIGLLIGIGGYLLGTKSNKNSSQPEKVAIIPSPTPLSTEASAKEGAPTANWKTYSSKDYSFKYPLDWYVENPSAVGGISFFKIGITPIHSNPDKLGNETLIITDYSVAKFDNLKAIRNADSSLASIETLVDGKSVLKSKSGKSADILIAHLENGKDHILNLNLTDQNNPLLLDQILSTFKFTDQNQTSNTSGWKTCINTQYSFTIQYPKDYLTNSSCGYGPSYALVKDAVVSQGDLLKKDYLISISPYVKNSLSFQEWIVDKLCPHFAAGSSCSDQKLGPIPSSVQFDALGRQYAGTHTVFERGNMIFVISLGARNPYSPISDVVKQLFNQILSTFKFTP